MSPEEVSLKEYLDVRLQNLEDKIDALSSYTTLHFDLNELAIKTASGDASVRKIQRDLASKDMDTRVKKLEMTSSFSAGKLWMAMVGFAAIPTILALIALFRG